MRRIPSRAAAYAAVALAASSWGTWALIIRRAEAIAPMPAALQGAIVMAVSTLVAAAFAWREPARAARPWSAWACVAWFGVGDVVSVLLFFAAYKLTIAVAVLTHYLTPVIVALTAPIVLRERMTVRTGVAVAVSFAGLALMLSRSGGGGDGGAAVWTSAALGTASAVFYASNVLVNKFIVEAFTTSQTMFWRGLVATALGLALVPASAWPGVRPAAAWFLAVAAIAPAGLGGLAFVWGLRRIPAAHASTLSLLEPFVSLLLGAALLGEPLGPPAIVGGALILGGALMVMTQERAPTAAAPAE